LVLNLQAAIVFCMIHIMNIILKLASGYFWSAVLHVTCNKSPANKHSLMKNPQLHGEETFLDCY